MTAEYILNKLKGNLNKARYDAVELFLKNHEGKQNLRFEMDLRNYGRISEPNFMYTIKANWTYIKSGILTKRKCGGYDEFRVTREEQKSEILKAPIKEIVINAYR